MHKTSGHHNLKQIKENALYRSDKTSHCDPEEKDTTELKIQSCNSKYR